MLCVARSGIMMSDVFVSYSHKDSEFAQRLNSMLKSQNFEVWIDWESIQAGKPFSNEIVKGIERAHSFIFIVNQHSLTSEICNQEIAHARLHNKRIIPLIRQKIDGDVEIRVKESWSEQEWGKQAEDNWVNLSHLNWLFFDNETKLESEFEKLTEALLADLDHIKTHTTLLIQAINWEKSEKNPLVLLMGNDLNNSEIWLKRAEEEGKVPVPTPLHRQYMLVSREHIEAEERRLRRLRLISLTAGVVSIIALILTVFAGRSASSAIQTAGTVQAQATFFADQQNYALLLSAGGIIVPPSIGEMPPDDFYETQTALDILRDWNPVIEEVNCIENDCVEIALVPEGCFWMGRNASDAGQPTGQFCFETPFWIDRYEVSEAVFARLGGQASRENSWDGPNAPRTDISWQEARDFCNIRGGTLPTEAHWEYAARGVDGSPYPWGSEWEPMSVAGDSNILEPIAVNTLPEGRSWVGAYHMAGNVWEWTSTIYGADYEGNGDLGGIGDIVYRYPYIETDGRENYTDDPSFFRVIRGGAYPFGSGSLHTGTRKWARPDLENFVTQTLGFRCAFIDVELLTISSCGNDSCEANENEETCRLDCGLADPTPTLVDMTPTASSCGNDICEAGENSSTCSADCNQNGSIDSDGDGVRDHHDRCPFDPGPQYNGGCPDDRCGNGICEAGENSGACPSDCDQDEDGDGRSNRIDRCPYEAGPQSNQGCPVDDVNDGDAGLDPHGDEDDDGRKNRNDNCPYEAGPQNNQGCPVDDADD